MEPRPSALQPLRIDASASWQHSGPFALDEDEQTLLLGPAAARAAAATAGAAAPHGLQRGVSVAQLVHEADDDGWSAYRHEAAR